jgi:hypothetical protein
MMASRFPLIPLILIAGILVVLAIVGGTVAGAA